MVGRSAAEEHLGPLVDGVLVFVEVEAAVVLTGPVDAAEGVELVGEAHIAQHSGGLLLGLHVLTLVEESAVGGVGEALSLVVLVAGVVAAVERLASKLLLPLVVAGRVLAVRRREELVVVLLDLLVLPASALPPAGNQVHLGVVRADLGLRRRSEARVLRRDARDARNRILVVLSDIGCESVTHRTVA